MALSKPVWSLLQRKIVFIILDSKQTCFLEKIIQNKKAVSVSAHRIFKKPRDLWGIVSVQVEDRMTHRMNAQKTKNSEMKEYNRVINIVHEGKRIELLCRRISKNVLWSAGLNLWERGWNEGSSRVGITQNYSVLVIYCCIMNYPKT